MSQENDADFLLRFKTAVNEAARIYEESWVSSGFLGGRYTISAYDSCVQAIEAQKLPTEMIEVLDMMQRGSWNQSLEWAKEKK